MRFGCQTYTWQMSLDKYAGRVDHVLRVVSQAGFAGLEAEVCMLGRFYDEPAALTKLLEKNGVALGAVCLVQPWRNPAEAPGERAEADKMFRFLEHFPGTLLALGQVPGAGREDLRERQDNAVACINAVARRARDAGLPCTFHPNSPDGSVFRTQEDYEILLAGLDDRAVGFAPDAGHMAKGGIDVVKMFRDYRDRIRHVHFKDMSDDGQWVEMGKGVLDFPQIVRDLRKTGYDGWIMIEDESLRAESDPDTVTVENGWYVHTQLVAP